MWGKRTQNTSLWDSSDLTTRLDAELDTLLGQLPAGIVGEVLYLAPGPKCLVTVAIRPDNAVLLPIRLRTTGGLIGRVWESGEAFGGPIDTQEVRAQRLHKSTSALVLPIRAHSRSTGPILGIASFESSSRDEPLRKSLCEGLSDGLVSIADELARIPADALSDDESVRRFLLDKIERAVAFILDPHELDEVYRQLRHATALLTSHPGTYASIILKHEDAQTLGFAGPPPQVSDGKKHVWVVPIPNKGDALVLPGPWDLLAEHSVTREVMLEKRALINIGDASEANVKGQRKQIAQAYDNGSELNVPIADGGGPFGALILLSSEKRSFDERDERMATTMTRYIAMVTRRIEDFVAHNEVTLETDEQQAFKNQLDTIIQRLKLDSDREILVDIVEVRDDALKLIAKEAKEKTHSEVGAVILKEEAPMEEFAPVSETEGELARRSGATAHHILAWNDAYLFSSLPRTPIAQRHPQFRLRPGEGLVGYAFAQEEALGRANTPGRESYMLSVPDVHHPVDPALEGKYIEAFEGVESELVTIIHGRRTRSRGAIDVESKTAGHYTRRDEHWMDFLAREAVEALDAADLAARRWFVERLYNFDKAMDALGPLAELKTIQQTRLELMQQLVDETQRLTQAEHAQIYLLTDAYDDQGNLKVNQTSSEQSGGPGALGALVTSPHDDFDDKRLHKHIDLSDESMAGYVVRTGQRAYFKDGERPSHRYKENIITAESALVVPIGKDQRIVGVVNLESRNPRWCGDLQIKLAEYAARLASLIQTNYMMRVESVQAKLLHAFGHETAHVEQSDIHAFLHTVLETADKLTISLAPRRWAQVALMYDGVIDFTSAAEFPQPDAPVYTDEAVDESAEQPRLHPAIANMLDAKHPDYLRPVFLPNTGAPTANSGDLATLPWNDAKSLICVPLFVEEDGGGAASSAESGHMRSARRTPIGFLTVASLLPYYLNDSDRDILSRFADVITHGLLDIAHLHARASLVREVRGRFGAITLPDDAVMKELHTGILKLGHNNGAGSHRAHEVAAEFQTIQDKLVVVGHLAHWYLILSSASPRMGSGVAPLNDSDAKPHLVALSKVEDILRTPMNTYVKIQLGAHVRWSWTPGDANNSSVPVGSQFGNDKEAVQLVCALLYGCIERASALARAANNNGHDVNVDIARQGNEKVAISINYLGDMIPESRLTVTPRYQAGDNTRQATYELMERRLVEVRRLARALDGDLMISARPHGERQELVLTLPIAGASSFA